MKPEHPEAAEGLIFVLSLMVIFWAIVTGMVAQAAPEQPTLTECVQRGWADTPQGPVFCTLVAERTTP